MTAEIISHSLVAREGWETRTRSVIKLSCTETEWITSEHMQAMHDGTIVFERDRSARIPRDHM